MDDTAVAVAAEPVVRITVDGTGTLPGLTAGITALCDRVEDAGNEPIALLRLGNPASAVSPWPGDVTIRDVNRWERAVGRVERLPAVVVAVATGVCAGPCADLLLAADVRVGAPGGWIRLAATDGRVWPGMALHRLARQVGVARARHVLVSGGAITAEEALRLALLDRLVAEPPADYLPPDLPAAADFRVRRQLLSEAPDSGFQEALGVHLAACERELRHAAAEGAHP